MFSRDQNRRRSTRNKTIMVDKDDLLGISSLQNKRMEQSLLTNMESKISQENSQHSSISSNTSQLYYTQQPTSIHSSQIQSYCGIQQHQIYPNNPSNIHFTQAYNEQPPYSNRSSQMYNTSQFQNNSFPIHTSNFQNIFNRQNEFSNQTKQNLNLSPNEKQFMESANDDANSFFLPHQTKIHMYNTNSVRNNISTNYDETRENKDVLQNRTYSFNELLNTFKEIENKSKMEQFFFNDKGKNFKINRNYENSNFDSKDFGTTKFPKFSDNPFIRKDRK